MASDWLVCYDVGFGGLGWFVGLLVVAVILGCCWVGVVVVGFRFGVGLSYVGRFGLAGLLD